MRRSDLFDRDNLRNPSQERRVGGGGPNPSDLYYRAQARRYAFEPDLARRDANREITRAVGRRSKGME